MRIEGEAQVLDLDRLSGLRLEIGDHPRPVAIHVEQDGYEENHHEQQSGDNDQDELGPAANGHGKVGTASGLCVTALPGLRLYASRHLQRGGKQMIESTNKGKEMRHFFIIILMLLSSLSM